MQQQYIVITEGFRKEVEMKTLNKYTRFLILASFISIYLILPVYGGVIPYSPVEPNGVEIPVLINVLGQSEPNDVNNAIEMIAETNNILKQANVQLAIEHINTDVNDIGDNDGILTQAEISDVLLASIKEMQCRNWPGKGVKINIADDVWAEKPELIFWNDNFYPVAFLESSQSPSQMGLTLAREVGVTAGLSSSSEPNNLMNPDGMGTLLNESQIMMILGLAKEIGFVRSSLAEGYSTDVLCELRHKSPGALFFSEGWTLKSDSLNDVLANNLPFQGGSDQEAFIAKSGLIDVNSITRTLVLKFYFYGSALADNTSLDTYLRMYHYGAEGNGSDGTQGDPFDTYDAVIGMGLLSSTTPYLGVINLLTTDRQFITIPEAKLTTEHDFTFNRTKVKAEIPFTSLQSKIPSDTMQSLINGCKLEILTKSYSFVYNPEQGYVSTEDYIENIKFESTPRPVPFVSSMYALGPNEVDINPGFHIRSVKPVEPPDANQPLRDFLELLFNNSVPIAEEGSRDSEFVNLNDSSSDKHGFFTADNNYPDANFPIGADSNNYNFGTEITAAVYLTKGLHILGAPGTGAAYLEIGGSEVGFDYDIHSHSWDLNDVNAIDPNSWEQNDKKDGDYNENHTHILGHRDWTFEVESEGFYPLRLRAWFGIQEASLEMTEVRKDGNRVLLNDAENNGSPVYLPIKIDF